MVDGMQTVRNGPSGVALTSKSVESNLAAALEEKDFIIREMRHRTANNLQILAASLQIKSRLCRSEEARSELNEAHRRVLGIAAIQQHLNVSSRGSIDVASYLFDLCRTLDQSMAGEDSHVNLAVEADSWTVSSRDAVNIGFIVTELVINALKYAFPARKPGASIIVSYRMADPDWSLTVCDNGVGTNAAQPSAENCGFGGRLVDLLAKQLDAEVATTAGPSGRTVSLTPARSLRAAICA